MYDLLSIPCFTRQLAKLECTETTNMKFRSENQGSCRHWGWCFVLYPNCFFLLLYTILYCFCICIQLCVYYMIVALKASGWFNNRKALGLYHGEPDYSMELFEMNIPWHVLNRTLLQRCSSHLTLTSSPDCVKLQ